MGDNFNEIGANTLPVHNVYLNGFFMDKLEVTKELWQAVQTWALGHGYTNLGGGSFFGNGHPVKGIKWSDAVRWCNARSEMEGLTPCYYTDIGQTVIYRIEGSSDPTNDMVKWNANGYRLPTEAEWEKAARGGIFAFRYPWGNAIDASDANYSGNGDPFETANPYDSETTPCGYYNGGQIPSGTDMTNGYGLSDMAGNVAEWCWDIYAASLN